MRTVFEEKRLKAPLWAWLMVVAALATGCSEVVYATIQHWPKVVTRTVPNPAQPCFRLPY